MSTTIAASTTSTATTDTSDVTALTTTFTPPARCTQASEMFSMLAPRSEIWANDPVPVSGSTVSSCYPSEWLADYTSTTKTTTFTGKATGMVSSIVPAMSPLVCPLRWETVLTAPGNYIACCPPNYSLASPKTTVDGYRPGYGGTCYSDLSSGQVLTEVTQYNEKSISATIPFTATAAGAQVYAHPIDGYSVQQAQVTVVETAYSSTRATTTSASILDSAAATQSTTALSESSSGSELGGGAIVGVVIGVVAGVALLAALLFFFLRRRRGNRDIQFGESLPGDEEPHEVSQTPAQAVEVKRPTVAHEVFSRGRNELDTDRGVDAELSGETRAPAELDAGYSSMDKR